jgi:hypothetical protein
MHMRSGPQALSTTLARLQGEGMHMRSGSLALATVLTWSQGEGMHMRSGSLALAIARWKRNKRLDIVRKLGGMHMRPELPIKANIGYLLINLVLISSSMYPATVRVLMQPLR